MGILLTFGRARVLLAGDTEKEAEGRTTSGSYTAPLGVLKVQKYKIARA